MEVANGTTDFYKTLGVSDDATEQEIKRSFRKLAKENHPDRHPGDEAKEKRFKEISEAYETLSDKKKRSEYDTLRRYGAFGATGGTGGAGASGFGYGAGGMGDLNDLFGNIFGAAASQSRRGGGFGGGFNFGGGGPFGSGFSQQPQEPQRGADASAELTIEFDESVSGAVKQVSLSGVDGRQKTIKVTIPKGIDNGEKIRLRGLGGPSGSGVPGSPAGDLLVTIKVKAHQKFTRKGVDIYSFVTIPFKSAALGAKVEVETLTKKVKLNIPAGTQPGAKLRLKGQGLNLSGKQGDQIVEIKVEVPTKLTKKQKEALEQF